MRVTSIAVHDFMGVAAARIDTDRPLTVITGPNGAGKTTLGQALHLARAAVAAADRGDPGSLYVEWAPAGHHGSKKFRVEIGMPEGWGQFSIFAPHRVLRTPRGFNESNRGPAVVVPGRRDHRREPGLPTGTAPFGAGQPAVARRCNQRIAGLREAAEPHREHQAGSVGCVAATELDGTPVVASSDYADAGHIWRPVIS